MLVNVYVLRLNTSIQQFIRPNTIAMVLLTSWLHTSRVCSDLSTRGDKHSIHDGRRATCHFQMRTLHPTKTGVTQIAISDPMEMRSRFPVAPVHDNQYGRVELLMSLQNPITSNTAADHHILRKFKIYIYIHSLGVFSLWILDHPLERAQTEPAQHSTAPLQGSKDKTRRLQTTSKLSDIKYHKRVSMPCWRKTFRLHLHDSTRNVMDIGRPTRYAMMIWNSKSDVQQKMSWQYNIGHWKADTYVGIPTFHRIWDRSHVLG